MIYGSSVGLDDSTQEYWHQDRGAIVGGSENGGRFGAALVAGRFGCGSNDDLVIGIPGENYNTMWAESEGAINVICGKLTGLGAPSVSRPRVARNEPQSLDDAQITVTSRTEATTSPAKLSEAEARARLRHAYAELAAKMADAELLRLEAAVKAGKNAHGAA